MGLVKDLIEGTIWGWSKKITVKDEDTKIHSYVRKFNFLGVDVLSMVDGVDPTQVNVYIPPTPYPDYYNQVTLIPSVSTPNRRVSAPTAPGAPFDIGAWGGNQIVPCHRYANLSYHTPIPCRFTDNATTTIEVNVIGANDVAVISTHTTAPIAGNIDVTVNNIRIQVVSFAPVGPIFEGHIYVDINIGAILATGGRHSIEIIHHQTLDYTKTQGPIFRDDETNVQTITGVSIAENTVSSAKYLSGIRYYDEGDTFDIGIADLDYLNSDSYPTNFVQILSNSEYGIGDFYLAGANLTGWNFQHDDIDDSYSSTKAINRDDFRFIGCDANITGRVIDWTPGASANSPDACICIDTWDQQSTDLSEYFTDETYRRTTADVIWDSTQDMNAYDDNLGMLDINGLLQTRYGDWNIYAPGLLTNPDYTGFAGWGTYYRRFIDSTSSVRTSVTMSISGAGFNLANLVNNSIRMWIFIPGRFTSWCYVHGAATYDFGTFDGDNDPIRVLSSTSTSIDITFGSLGLTPAQNYFIMWLEISNPAITPDSIVCSW